MPLIESPEAAMQHQMINMLALTIAKASIPEHREQDEHTVEDAKSAFDIIVH